MNTHSHKEMYIWVQLTQENIFDLPKWFDTFQNQVQVMFAHSVYVMTFKSQFVWTSLRKYLLKCSFFFFWIKSDTTKHKKRSASLKIDDIGNFVLPHLNSTLYFMLYG